MKRQLLVTAAIVQNQNGEYLLTQRPLDKHNGGRWEFPGGKVDFGEDLRECLKREIDEELGVSIKVGEPVEYSSHVYDNEKHVVLLGFKCTFIEGTIKHKEIKDHAWVRASDFNKFDITEADIPFLDKL